MAQPQKPYTASDAQTASSNSRLAVRLCNWIGDVVLSLPALQLLSDSGYDLHLYGKGWAPNLLSAYPWPVTVRKGSWSERKAQVQAMRASQGLTFPNSFSGALDLRLAGLPVTGYANDGRSFLLKHRLSLPSKTEHALLWMWQLAAHHIQANRRFCVPAPPVNIDMHVAPSADKAAIELILAYGLQCYVCIAPFATGKMYGHDKKWPHFSEFVQRMKAEGVQVVVCPGPGEEVEARAVYSDALLLPDVPLDVYAALLKRAALVVANDTGPAHIAAAVGTPLISILGPTPLAHWRPWGEQVQVISCWPSWPSSDDVWVRASRVLEKAV
jgi:heptosyltransferase II